jgi:hypothetical protein
MVSEKILHRHFPLGTVSDAEDSDRLLFDDEERAPNPTAFSEKQLTNFPTGRAALVGNPTSLRKF